MFSKDRKVKLSHVILMQNLDKSALYLHACTQLAYEVHV